LVRGERRGREAAVGKSATAGEAMTDAARADQLLEDGDWQGAATCHRNLGAIERLQALRRRW
jgi:hypothetical protein